MKRAKYISNGTITYKIVGDQGPKGDKGDSGTGIESITEEYYLSTSKTEQTNGSWSTTHPTWESGKYIWDRKKIVYKNPTSIVYTIPICELSLDTVNEVLNIYSINIEKIITAICEENDVSGNREVGGFVITDGRISSYDDNKTWRRIKVECTEGEFLKVKVNLAPNPNKITQAVFVDSNDNVIKEFCKCNGTEMVYTINVTVPKGASRIIVKSYYPDETREKVAVYKFDEKELKRRINETEYKVKNIINEFSIEGDVDSPLMNGAVQYNDSKVTGINADHPAWKYMNIPCSEGDKFKVYVVIAPNTVKQVIFTDENDNIVGYDVVGERVEEERDVEVTAPIGAAKMYVSSYAPDSNRRKLRVANYSLKNFSGIVKDFFATTEKVNNDHEPRISKLEKRNETKLPDYYVDHVESKISEIRNNTKIIKGDTFAYVTDLHFGFNSLSSKEILKEVLDKTSVTKIFSGGDFVVASGDENECEKSGNILQEYKKYLGNAFYPCHGNHDFTIKYTGTENGKTLQKPYLYDYNIRSIENNVCIGEVGELYYYLDNEAQRIRYIFVDDFGTSLGSEDQAYGVVGEGLTQKQFDWLIKIMTNVENYKFVVFTHATTDSQVEGFSGQIELYRLLTAINQKQNIDYRSELGRDITIKADFTNTTNEVICSIAGHSHKDRSLTRDGLLSITTTCDAYYNDDTDVTTRTKGTVTESAVDVFTIDLENRRIKTVRIGGGANREFTF